MWGGGEKGSGEHYIKCGVPRQSQEVEDPRPTHLTISKWDHLEMVPKGAILILTYLRTLSSGVYLP